MVDWSKRTVAPLGPTSDAFSTLLNQIVFPALIGMPLKLALIELLCRQLASVVVVVGAAVVDVVVVDGVVVGVVVVLVVEDVVVVVVVVVASQLPAPSHAPPVHGVPTGLGGFEHMPVAGAQVPAWWHSSRAVQTTAVPAAVPPLQVSFVVQALPSSHGPV